MANSYLVRTPSSAGNRKTFTISVWVKRSKLSYDYAYMVTAGEYNQDQMAQFKFDSNDQFNISGYASNGSKDFRVHTNRKFRDTSAWYHILVAVDTTQATASNRVKVYVNGVQETSFSEATYPSQNYDTAFNLNGIQSNIGVRAGTGVFFEGYLSHVAIVDGTALTPTSFGETDSTSGIWKFKSPSGLSWGTNGVHLKFENSGALGTDSSGQSNTYTVNGNLKQAIDTPSNSLATMNNLHNFYESGTYAYGNNQITTGGSNKYTYNNSTFGVKAGKWYMEYKWVSGGSDCLFGVTDRFTGASNHELGTDSKTFGYRSNGTVRNSNGNLGGWSGATFSTGDIIGVALDMDNDKLYFHKNGTYQNSGDPTSGSTGTGAVSISSDPRQGFYWFAACMYDDAQGVLQSNFGNGYFGTTQISSAGSNGNGALFEYDCPSGYYALNTKNINTYG